MKAAPHARSAGARLFSHLFYCVTYATKAIFSL